MPQSSNFHSETGGVYAGFGWLAQQGCSLPPGEPQAIRQRALLVQKSAVIFLQERITALFAFGGSYSHSAGFTLKSPSFSSVSIIIRAFSP